MPDLITPEPQHIVPLFRALHCYHAERRPLAMHTHGTDEAYLNHLQDKAYRGAWFFAHDAGWGLVSYLIAMPRKTADPFLNHSGLDVQLDHLYVAPSHRGQGLARALIAAMEQRMVHARIQTWTVGFHSFNDTARMCYQQAGAGPKGAFYEKRMDLPKRTDPDYL